ncbi:MAG: hypothetical protein KBG15_24765, partial [Kofleriaceae bacterium]|nr:hypothetical protein [Kofleriaceae bacterium]
MSASRLRHRVGFGVAGALLVGLHVVALATFGRNCRSPNLSVDLQGAMADQKRSLTGTVPAQLRARTVQRWESPDGPGLQRVRWSIERRGGQIESVAATQLVGPFIDPAHVPCSGRVVVGQALLQLANGEPSTGTVAAVLAPLIDDNLRGVSVFGIGAYRRVGALTVTWAQESKHADDRSMLPPAQAGADRGYARITFDLHFDRIVVPMVLALLPEVHAGQLTMKMYSRGRVEIGNRVLQWASDKLGGNQLVTKLARQEMGQLVLNALAPPPPVALPGGGTLVFTYCDQPLQIVDRKYASLPMAVQIMALPAAPTILPPVFGPTPWPAVPATTKLALDLSLDGLNSIIFECWRQGLLDRVLGDAGLDRSFNTDPLVTEFLSVRISPLRMALPPVVSVQAGQLIVSSLAVATLADQAAPAKLLGHVWSQLALQFAGTAALPHVSLQALALTCEPRVGHLEACYPLLTQAVAGRTKQFDSRLTNALAGVLSSIFVGTEFTAPEVPGTLQLSEVM